MPLFRQNIQACPLSPDFFTIFDEIMEAPVTNAVLEKKLTAYKRRKPKSTTQYQLQAETTPGKPD